MEAIERVKERAFDMVFMDIKMPLINGVETYKEIKKIKPEMVVIMMTAYTVRIWFGKHCKKEPIGSSTSRWTLRKWLILSTK